MQNRSNLQFNRANPRQRSSSTDEWSSELEATEAAAMALIISNQIIVVAPVYISRLDHSRFLGIRAIFPGQMCIKLGDDKLTCSSVHWVIAKRSVAEALQQCTLQNL